MTESILTEILNHPEFKENEFWHRQSFASGVQIFHQDDPAENLYLVISGKVRITYTVVLNDDRHIQPGIVDLEVDEIFGEMAVLDNSPRSASASVVEDTILIVINGEKLLTFLDSHQNLGYSIMKHFYSNAIQRLRLSTQRFGSVFAWGLKAHNIEKHL